MGKSLSFDNALEILNSREDCTFRGRTDSCVFYHFKNHRDIALECPNLAPKIPLKDASVMVWVSNVSVIEDFLKKHSHTWIFGKGSERTRFLGTKVYGKTLSESFEAVRIQIKKLSQFEDLLKAYCQPTPEQEELRDLKIFLRTYPELINESIDSLGTTVLMKAVKSNKFEIVEFLISKGAKISQKNSEGMSALDFAKTLENSRCIEILENALVSEAVESTENDAGHIDRKVRTEVDNEDVSLMVNETVTNDDILQYILSHPQEINASIDEEGTTPLILAVKARDFELVKLLLRNGAKLDKEDSHGKTALDYSDDEEFRLQILSEEVFDVNEIALEDKSENKSSFNKEPLFVNEYQELKGENIFGSLFDEDEEQNEESVNNVTDLSPTIKDQESDFPMVLSQEQRLAMCLELKDMDVSESVRFVFIGMQSGWTDEEIVALTSEDFFRKNASLFKALSLYFMDKFK